MGSAFKCGQPGAKPLLMKLKITLCIVLLSYSAVVADDFPEQAVATASEPSHTDHRFVPSKPIEVVFASSGSTANSPDADEATATPGTRKVIAVNDVPFSFRWCPPGEFLMGSPDDKREQYGDAFVTQHRVKISRGFWLQETEITQAQYERVTGQTPSFWRSKIVSSNSVISREHVNDNPVEQVSWTDASSFCEELTKLDVNHRFRLPTEAEWEYACRGGQPECRYGKINDIAWVFENTEVVVGEGSIGHMAVGRKTPNAWGLYDMLGNVSEWCSDWLGPPATRSTIDPTGPASGTYRVARGGNCFADRGELRTEGLCMAGTRDRDGGLPQHTVQTRGFRIVLVTNDNQNGPPSASLPSSRSKRTEANLPDAHFIVRQIRQLADEPETNANTHVIESQKFVDDDNREPLLTEADILLFGALMTQKNDRDSHMSLILTDETKATLAEALNQAQTADDASIQLGIFIDGELLGVIKRFSSTTGLVGQIRDSSISMRLNTGAAVRLRKFLTQSCFHSPCQTRSVDTDFDGVKLKARLLVKRGEDGQYHVVTDWIWINSSPAERTLRIKVTGKESETRTLKPKTSTRLFVPVDFGSQSILAGKFYVTPGVTVSGGKYQLVSTISEEKEGQEETTIPTTSPEVAFELVDGSQHDGSRSGMSESYGKRKTQTYPNQVD